MLSASFIVLNAETVSLSIFVMAALIWILPFSYSNLGAIPYLNCSELNVSSVSERVKFGGGKPSISVLNLSKLAKAEILKRSENS